MFSALYFLFKKVHNTFSFYKREGIYKHNFRIMTHSITMRHSIVNIVVIVVLNTLGVKAISFDAAKAGMYCGE